MITRAQILQVLEGELNALEDRELEDNHANALHQVLLLLIDGLEKLEKGEVPSVLAPSKVKSKGKAARHTLGGPLDGNCCCEGPAQGWLLG